MITTFTAFILGVVEGLTEFLPISSTAHLTLASQLLGLAQSDAVKSFEIVIQGGAILAVLAIYWRKFLDMEVLKKLATAFIPTAVVGFVLYRLIKDYLIGNMAVTLGAMIVGGAVLILFEKLIKSPMDNAADIWAMSYKSSMLIGLAQAVAVIPGVSRSAATIVGGLWLGLSRKAIVEFSFLLAVPTILAAAGYDLFKNFDVFSSTDLGPLGVGFAVSFITALLAIKFFISYIQKRSFVAFGVYRIAIALVFMLWYSFA